MTCQEFERVLPESEGGIELRSHLDTCSACAGLVADLDAISQQARLLRDTDEPSPRVWNSIEIALRQEGLIRPRRSLPFLVPRRAPRGRLAWLIPATAAIVLMFGVVYYGRSPVRISQRAPAPSAADSEIAEGSSPADRQLLEVVARRAPAMRESYAANLRDVNSYIRDAETSAKINPNDEQAQQYLMSAYEQKSMVYEMALDRSLP